MVGKVQVVAFVEEVPLLAGLALVVDDEDDDQGGMVMLILMQEMLVDLADKDEQ